jgi:hypothetical protein
MKNTTMGLIAKIPDDLLYEFLQHLRDFESQNPEQLELQIMAVSGLPSGQVQAILNEIRPPFDFKFQSKVVSSADLP